MQSEQLEGTVAKKKVYSVKDIRSILSSNSDYKELPATEYTIRRILHGIPEGTMDMWPEQSLPLESNFDYMNGGWFMFCIFTRR